MDKKKEPKSKKEEALRVGQGRLPYIPRVDTKEQEKLRFARIRKHLNGK